MQALICAFSNARWIPGVGGPPGRDLVRLVASRLWPMPIYAQAKTGITPSEEKRIQLKNNTAMLSAGLLRAGFTIGPIKKDWPLISANSLIDQRRRFPGS